MTTRFDQWMWMSTALAAVGGAGLLFYILRYIVELGIGLTQFIQRKYRPAAIQILREANQNTGGTADLHSRQGFTRLLLLMRPTWVVMSILVAVLIHDSLRSMAFFVFLVVAGEAWRHAFDRKRHERINLETANLILQFTARYPLKRSLRNSLQAARDTLSDGEIARGVDRVLQNLNMNRPMKEALHPFNAVPNPVLGRFAAVLSMAQFTSTEVFLDTLEMLRTEVENRMELHRAVRQTLTTTIGTVRVLQGFLVFALVVATTVPSWRAYFLVDQHWTLMAIMLVMSALSSLYFENEICQLEA